MTAPGYGCAFDDTQPVAWLVTNMVNGSTISLCADDFPVGMIPLIAASLGVDPTRLYDTVKRFVDREAAREARTTAKAPAAAPASPGADDDHQAHDDHQAEAPGPSAATWVGDDDQVGPAAVPS